MPRPVAALALAMGSLLAKAPAGPAEPRALGVRTWSNQGFTCRMGPLAPVPTYRPVGPETHVRVLSYNLFWWMLFDKNQPGALHWYRRTPGNGATALINQHLPFDVLGFTECFDEKWLLVHSGLAPEYTIFRDRACCMAFRHIVWDFLGKGVAYPTADRFGRRPAQWMRLKHKGSGQIVFFVNHHGALPLNSGGLCGPGATVFEMLEMVKQFKGENDAVISVGDFNADAGSATIKMLSQHLHSAFASGLDRIFTNMAPAALVSSANLGKGGSDHDAISAVLRIGVPGSGPPPPVAAVVAAQVPDGYDALGGVAREEGQPAGDRTERHHTLQECAGFCDATPGCLSFSYAGSTDGWCHLKRKCIEHGEPIRPPPSPYKTYFRKACGSPVPQPAKTSEYRATEKVLEDEGEGAGDHMGRHYSVAECSAFCDATEGCRSFSYAGSEDGWCHLKTKCVTASDPLTNRPTAFRTYYKACEGLDGRSSEFLELGEEARLI